MQLSIPLISVVICTYNRAIMLAEAIDSFFQMELPQRSEYELLIVNNNSNDQTEKIVTEKIEKFGSNLKYIFEPNPGLSQARNRGVFDSRAPIIAFVDDDVFFDKKWLKNIIEAFDQNNEYHAIGGRIEAIFEIERPTWLSDERLKHYSFGSTRLGNLVKVLKFPEYPSGSNMAIRRSAIMLVGGFSTNLGRSPRSLLSNEESEFFYRFGQLNLLTLYSPNALIHHRVPKNRISRRWIISRFYWQGVSNTVMKNNLSTLNRIDHIRNSILSAQNIFFELFGKKIHPVTLIKYILDFRLERIVVIALNFGVLKQSILFFLKRKES